MQKPIVVVGSINMDLAVGTQQIPRVGQTVHGTSFQTFAGGKGANQAVAVARLNYPVAMVGCVGADDFGQRLSEGLRTAGVDTSNVRTVNCPSGVALITTNAKGENNIVVVPGANAELTPAVLEESSSLLATAGMLLTQLETPLETVEYLAAFAKRQGVPLMLDPAPACALPATLLQNVAWLTPNETEAQTLLQRELRFEADTQAAVEELLARGAKNVLLKLGDKGAVVLQKSRVMERIAPCKVNAVDTTAAGDAFNAGFAVSLLRGHSVLQSAEYASAVAALAVTRPGAQQSLPMQHEVDAFLATRKISGR